MKKSNKYILLGLTSLAISSAPIITLASCGCHNKASFEIDESEKTKSIEKGAREVTYSIKVNCGLKDGESFRASLNSVTSSQDPYTVNIIKGVEFNKETSIASVTVNIVSSTDELLKDGTNFHFNLNIEKVNGETTTDTVNLEGFTLTYGVPTTSEVVLQGDAQTYTNPGENVHSYLYKVGSSCVIDKDCKFECDVEKISAGSAEDVDVAFANASYDENTQNLIVTFRLESSRELEETDVVNFNFNLSCTKDGKEVWRQNFTNYQLTYAYHVMWIFKDYQWDATYANENTFNLYIVKNSNISKEDLTQESIKLTVDDSTNDAVELTWDINTVTVKEYTGPTGVYSYFDVPVTIKNIGTEDMDINYTVTLGGKIGGTTVTRDFDESIKYVAKKVTPTVDPTKDYLNNVVTKQYSFTLENELEANQELVCELIKTSGKTLGVTATATTTVVTKAVTVDVTVSPEALIDEIGFNLRLICRDKTTKVSAWEQNSIGYTLATYASAKAREASVKTELGTEYGFITLDLSGKAGTAGALENEGDVSIKTDTVTYEITSSTGVSDIKPNIVTTAQSDVATLEVQLLPMSGAAFTNDSKATFNVTLSGTILINGTEQTWTRTLTGLTVQYDGRMIYTEATREKTTEAGVTTCTYRFFVASDTDEIAAQLIPYGSSSNVAAEIDSFVITEKIGLLTVKIKNTNNDPLIHGDFAKFDIKFTATGSGKVLWEQTLKEFGITYKAAITCDEPEVRTYASSANADIEFNDATGLPEGGKYKFEVLRQTQIKGVKVIVGEEPSQISGTKLTLPITLDKSDPLEQDDYCQFDLKVSKLSSTGEVAYSQRILNLKVTYDVNRITWASGWYAADMTRDESGYAYSDTTDVVLTLDNALSTGQTLSASYELVDSETTSQRILVQKGDITVSGTKVTIPLCMKSTGSSFLYFGDHVTYNVTITCTNSDGTTAWHQKLNDLYIYLFVNYKLAESEKTKSTKSSATMAITHSISVSKTYTGFSFETTIDNIKPTNLPDTAKIEPVGGPTYVTLEKTQQSVKWSDTTGFTEGGYCTYNMHITITCSKYPTQPVTFDFTGLKLIYQ